MIKFYTSFTFILFLSSAAFAQVDEIKNASKSSSSASNYTESVGGGSGIVFDLAFNLMFGQVIEVQQQKLAKKHDVPGMVSFDVTIQSAVQPSDYYVVQPRLRANWGLFSTDFRFSYLIEEEIDKVNFLRTTDWQILQLNLITTREVVFRVGGGVMQEAFNEHKSYPEWTAALHVLPQISRIGGAAEYRSTEPRKEVSAYAMYRLFEHRSLHGFLTAGAAYQRYYQSISVWGFQGGFILKLY
jgi:hypothetical protein